MAMYDYDEFVVIYTGLDGGGRKVRLESEPTRDKRKIRSDLRALLRWQPTAGLPADAAVYDRHIHMGVSAWRETTIR